MGRQPFRSVILLSIRARLVGVGEPILWFLLGFNTARTFRAADDWLVRMRIAKAIADAGVLVGLFKILINSSAARGGSNDPQFNEMFVPESTASPRGIGDDVAAGLRVAQTRPANAAAELRMKPAPPSRFPRANKAPR